MTATEVVVALVTAQLAGTLLRGVLFQTRTSDPAALIAAAGILVVAAVIACAVPAWRAARVEPLEGLRAD